MFTVPIPAWMEKEKIKSIYILVADYAPGHDIEAAMVEGSKKIGAQVLGAERIPLSTTDFAPYMERAARANPELVYIFMPAGAPSIAIIREFAKRGLKEKGIRLAGSGEIQEISSRASAMMSWVPSPASTTRRRTITRKICCCARL